MIPTIYTIAYNEEVFLKFFIDHYRSRFPNCKIVVYDNMSTDNTVKIAKDNNCEVIQYNTNNQIQDSKYLEIKNNCWKSATTDWVAVCDVDELVFINAEELSKEDSYGATIINFEGYNMVNLEENFDFQNIKYGERSQGFDKRYLFNRRHLKEINYSSGCHYANPVGAIKYSSKQYLAGHFKCLNVEYVVSRHKMFGARLSDENKRYGWGHQYLFDEQKTRDSVLKIKQNAKKVLP